MNRLKLVLPTPDYKSKVMDYKREFVENGDRIYGSGGLKNATSFNTWYISFWKGNPFLDKITPNKNIPYKYCLSY